MKVKMAGWSSERPHECGSETGHLDPSTWVLVDLYESKVQGECAAMFGDSVGARRTCALLVREASAEFVFRVRFAFLLGASIE